MASASLLTDYIKGKSVKEIEKIDLAFMQDLIGTTVSPGRVKCLTLGAKALMNLLNQALENSDSTKI
jgi:NifU-like protein involved in Fe-S cluster formation